MRTAHVHNAAGKYGVALEIGPHRVIADEPVAEGGDDAGPTPRELLLGALGGCTSATVKLYANRKGWKVADVDVVLELISEPGKKAIIKKKVTITGELDADQHKRLLEIADKCPVHKILVEGADIQH